MRCQSPPLGQPTSHRCTRTRRQHHKSLYTARLPAGIRHLPHADGTQRFASFPLTSTHQNAVCLPIRKKGSDDRADQGTGDDPRSWLVEEVVKNGKGSPLIRLSCADDDAQGQSS